MVKLNFNKSQRKILPKMCYLNTSESTKSKIILFKTLCNNTFNNNYSTTNEINEFLNYVCEFKHTTNVSQKMTSIDFLNSVCNHLNNQTNTSELNRTDESVFSPIQILESIMALVNITCNNSGCVTTSSSSPSPQPFNLTTILKNLQIILYALIFLLAVIGNSLVIVTLARNVRMRTITNVFLLNLAVSDLMLGVLCMPFTLMGTLLRDFVFGELLCRLLPFLQASCVSVSAWTLVALSVERYHAICHPLKTRGKRTVWRARRLIAFVWICSFTAMSPILIVSELIPIRNGHHKCRELWSSASGERTYNIFLDVILLVLPLVILVVTYSLIAKTLWKGIRAEKELKRHLTASNGTMEVYLNSRGSAATRCRLNQMATSYSSSQMTPQNKRRNWLPRRHHDKSTQINRHFLADFRRKRFREENSQSSSHKSFDRDTSLRSTVTQSSWCPHVLCGTTGDITCKGDVTINNVTINNITTCGSGNSNGSKTNLSNINNSVANRAVCCCESSKNISDCHKKLAKSNSDSITNCCHNCKSKSFNVKCCRSDANNYHHSKKANSSVTNICDELDKINLATVCNVNCLHHAKIHHTNDIECNNLINVYAENSLNVISSICNENMNSCPPHFTKNNSKYFNRDLLSCCHGDEMRNCGCANYYSYANNKDCCPTDNDFKTKFKRSTKNYLNDDIENGVNDFTLKELTSTPKSLRKDLSKKAIKLESLRKKQCSKDSNTAINILTENWKTQVPELRRTNAEKSLMSKKRVIQMLGVVVLEFFICWTPLYVINTLALFNPDIVYKYLGYSLITYCQLLAYVSACCNPITYCFMNRRFREAFLRLLGKNCQCCCGGRRTQMSRRGISRKSSLESALKRNERDQIRRKTWLTECRSASEMH